MPKAKFKKQCTRCGRMKGDYDFFKYRSKPGEPEKWHDLCKTCLTANVDNWNPDTFKWILKELDFPYVESVWVQKRDKACDEAGPEGLTGTSVLGKYIVTMRLKQFKDYGYEDSDKLNAEYVKTNQDIQEYVEQQKELNGAKIAEMEEKYKIGEISKDEFESFVKTYTAAPPDTEPIRPRYSENPIDEEALMAQNKKGKGKDGPFNVANNKPLHEDLEAVDMDEELSREDKIYLLNKWGDGYTTNEWVALEKSYQDYMNSFDIQGASREQQLLAICKVYLKMNQALDINDYEGFQRLNKMYIDLQKAAKFTEAQNKEVKDDAFDSLGEMVRLCEQEQGFIPEYDFSSPQDAIDYAIADMNNYVKELVTNELGFGNMIEAQLKKIAQENEEKELEELKTEDEIIQEEEEKLENISSEDDFKRALFDNTNALVEEEEGEDPDPQVDELPALDIDAELHKYDKELKGGG